MAIETSYTQYSVIDRATPVSGDLSVVVPVSQAGYIYVCGMPNGGCHSGYIHNDAFESG